MSDLTDPAHSSGTVDLLWGLRPRKTRGPKPAWTLEQIALAAVTVADCEGLDAVSMQRVAGDLDFTKMALYRYVAGKSDLVAAMIEAAVGEPPDLGGLRGGWRKGLEKWVRLLSATWEEHSWLPWATVGDRVMGPNEVGWIEVAVGVLSQTSLSPAERMDVVTLICGHIRNTQSVDVAGTQPWNSSRQFELIRDRAEDYPTLARIGPRRASSPRQTRAFGLRCILDGLELHMGPAGGPPNRRGSSR